MAIVVFNAKAPNVEDLKRSPARTFRIGDHFLTLKQNWSAGGDGGTLLGFGASVYDAAFLLSDYLGRRPVPLSGKRVVELGTGPGLVAIAAALLGAAEVEATDGDAELLSLTEGNIELNIKSEDIRQRCHCTKLMWGDHAAAAALRPPFDIVLAADCAAVVYEHAFEDLVSSLVSLSGPSSIVLLAYQRRHRSEDVFFELLQLRFTVSEVPEKFIHPDFKGSNIQIFDLKLRI